MKRLILMLALCVLALPAQAIDSGVAFEDPALQARYDRIISEVRCLMCQNESIKDSNAFLAADLRREIRRMIEEGLRKRRFRPAGPGGHSGHVICGDEAILCFSGHGSRLPGGSYARRARV